MASTKLSIAGIDHNDPLGAQRLHKWIQELKQRNTILPAFVGIEWDKDIFSDAISQRERSKDHATRLWPSASAEEIEILCHSLGFEGDTHLASFPEAEVVWLDEGRVRAVINRLGDREDLVANYGVRRLDRMHYCSAVTVRKPNETLLQWISRAVAINNNRPPLNSGSDALFSERLSKRIEKEEDGWAIVIVGASYASDQEGSMCRLLEQNGVSCEVTILGHATGERQEPK